MTAGKPGGFASGPLEPTELAIPHLQFSTDALSEAERHDAYRDLVSVSLEASDPQDAFFADLKSWRMDRMVFTRSHHGAQSFSRDAQRLRRDGLDHYVLQAAQRGTLQADADGVAIAAAPGEIMLFDLTRPMTLRTSEVKVVTLSVARPIIDAVAPGRNLHGLVLNGAHGGLLADVLAAVSLRLPQMSLAALPGVTASLSGLLTNALTAEAPEGERGEDAERVLLIRARAHVERNLGSRDLTPDALCAALGVSRSKLYRLFEPLGGVSQYIWGRRLEAARRALVNPNTTTRVSQLGFGLGFASESHFSRAFRGRYGMSASEMLALYRAPPGLTADLPSGGPADAFAGWIGALK